MENIKDQTLGDFLQELIKYEQEKLKIIKEKSDYLKQEELNE